MKNTVKCSDVELYRTRRNYTPCLISTCEQYKIINYGGAWYVYTGIENKKSSTGYQFGFSTFGLTPRGATPQFEKLRDAVEELNKHQKRIEDNKKGKQ